MSRSSKPASGKTWGWRRWITTAQQEPWIAKLEAVGCATWTATGKPDSSRLLLAVYSADKSEITALGKKFGGQVRAIAQKEWLPPSRPTPPTRIGGKLEIVHADTKRTAREKKSLHVPHGIAFGSGEHATTFMLLKALANLGDFSHARVLDLGTGSGVLALAARHFGAKKIVATDFDPDSVRTARQNEALNFPTPLIRWQQADVKKLRPSPSYDLVLANLFSGILIEAAPQIAKSVSPSGQLWLSGILNTQEKEVVAAYRKRGLKLARSNHRGKWVMLQWAQPA